MQSIIWKAHNRAPIGSRSRHLALSSFFLSLGGMNQYENPTVGRMSIVINRWNQRHGVLWVASGMYESKPAIITPVEAPNAPLIPFPPYASANNSRLTSPGTHTYIENALLNSEGSKISTTSLNAAGTNADPATPATARRTKKENLL